MPQIERGTPRRMNRTVRTSRGSGAKVALTCVLVGVLGGGVMFACQPARATRPARSRPAPAPAAPAAAPIPDADVAGLAWGAEAKPKPAVPAMPAAATPAASTPAPAPERVQPAAARATVPTEPYAGTTEAISGSFGIAPSGECGRELPKIMPMLREAGVSMLRSFPEWPGIQPARGVWNWDGADALVKMARDNRIRLFGLFCYLTPWASSGGTRRFPIKDIQYWREYTEAVVTRYRNDIQDWEVYNEFNSGAFAENGTPKDYAELVKNSYEVAKKANPACKVGMGCASVAISFFEQVIEAGAGGCFDFLNVHPYELLAAAMGGREAVFLRMSANLRAMLKKHKQRDDIEIWVSEIGWNVTDNPASEREQAEAVAKSYVLCFAQGVTKVFWFEARGPYKMDLIRGDWSKRPSYTTLQLMTRLLGPVPKSIGWHNPTGKSYGFLLQGATEPVLVMWATSDAGDVVRFDGEVTVTDVVGAATTAAAKRDVRLTRSPVFVTRLPASLVAKSRADAAKPFPWLQDYGAADSVYCHTGAENVDGGISLLTWGDGATVADLVDGIHIRRTDKRTGMNYMYFDVDDSYAAVGDRALEITVVARRTDDAKGCRFVVCYESTNGYKGTNDAFDIPAGGWQQHTFRVNDANFGNAWGWNFRIDVAGSASDVYVKEVTVKRIGPKS